MEPKVDTSGTILIVTSLFAHRGYHAIWPENSVAAVRAAREIGADGIEVDVWLSADKSLVVNHDRTVQGLDVTRAPRSELTRVAALASLDEVLEAAGGLRVNVEIKSTRSAPYNRSVASAVAHHLDGSRVSDQCLVSSFSLEICDEVRRISPRRKVGWLVTRKMPDTVLSTVVAHRLTSAHLPFSGVNAAVARRARDIGVELHVWTPNLARDLEEMIDLGVGALITDDVPLALSLRARHAATAIRHGDVD